MSRPNTSPLPPVPLAPRAYLVHREPAHDQRSWPVALPEHGTWKVTGAAGSGVSSFLVDTVVAAVEQHGDASGVLVLTDSKESAARLRSQLSARLASSSHVTEGAMVRSVHSLAFAIVRDREPGVRLISGAEQDAMIRQLLQGQAEDGRGTWPEELRPAMTMVGFARQLRDFLLRAIERGLGPEELVELGRAHSIPVWAASGDFLREYRQVMALSGARGLSASELVAEALDAPLPRRWHTVVVDDAQMLAPASAALVTRLLHQADLAVVGGDVEQSVFRFRGASDAFLRDLGGLDHRVIDLGPSRREPERRVTIASDTASEFDAVADALRRAHFEDGVAYRDMAVIVRSSSAIEPVRRALLHTGVPVMLNPTDLVLGQQRIVASLLLGARSLYEELTAAQWRDLLLGPVGGADPVTLRRLLRGLRRWNPDERAEETLRELLIAPGELPDFGTVLTDRELDFLRRVRGVVEAGRRAVAGGGSVEEVLWALWHATGLSNRLLAASLRGGAGGSQADRDLDAVMALFDAAGDYTERRPHSGIESFVDTVTEQVLPSGVRDRRSAKPDAVSLLTAHAAVGREFSRVVVCGVQELTWPSLGETGSLFRQEDLVDLIDREVDPAVPVPRIAERMREERRLFALALSRATCDLLVTAVDAPDGEPPLEPSRFVGEFCAEHGLNPAEVGSNDPATRSATDPDEGVRVLSRDHIIAELRRALTAPGVSDIARRQAARQLARLARAGVMGADPEQWWVTTEPSTSESLGEPAALSPSRIEKLLECPMRAELERMVGLDETLEMIYGSMAHAYLEALGRGVEETDARRAVLDARRAADYAPAWKRERDLADFEAMLDRTRQWLESSRGAFEQVAVEAPVDVQVSEHVRIRGRVDRLEREEHGAVHIVDLKTGATPPTAADAAANPQLMAYQLAVSRGMLHDGSVADPAPDSPPLEVGGAVLVYPNAGKARLTTREQPPKTADELDDFRRELDALPAQMAGPELMARTGAQCERCAVRSLCPVQPEGEVNYRA